MYISKSVKLFSLYFVLVLIWGLTFFFIGIKQSQASYWFQFFYGLVPLIGGLVGIFKAKKWGYLKSKVGRALVFISLGTASWGMGQMFWSLYYNILMQVEIPYPSFADFFYTLALPFWIIGIINLSKATGIYFSLKHLRGKFILFFIPVAAIIVSYYLLIVLARGGSIPLDGSNNKLFFDFAYPLGDLLILTLSLLVYGLSFNYLGGKYKIPILAIIGGFIIMYIADFSFSYTTTLGTYYNGNISDLLFCIALFTISFGVWGFDTKDA